MIIGPKYKIARRLGAGVFEKTQTAKFALRQSNQKKVGGKRGGPKTDFGIQMLEKQKARFSYALTEKQFSNYVKKALDSKGNSREMVYESLESRLDSIVLRAGFAPTRSAAKQMVSHGHIMVNGKRVTIPSYQVKVGDKLTIRESSAKKPLFATLAERLKEYRSPSWIVVDASKNEIKVQGKPKLESTELIFDIDQVLEFYSR